MKSRSYTSGVKSPKHDANMTSLSRAPCLSLARPRPCPLPVLGHYCLMLGGWLRWRFWQRQGCVWTALGSAPPGSASARTSDWSPAQPDSRKQPWHQEPSTTWQQKTTLTTRAQPDGRKQLWFQGPNTTWWQKTTDIRSPAQPDGEKQLWYQEPSTTWWEKTTWISGAQHNLMC